SGNPVVANGDRNDYWFSQADSEAQMLYEMRTMDAARRILGLEQMDGYTFYKRIPVTDAKPDDAWNLAGGQQGYGVLLHNCLDNGARIGDAYGVPVWSWTRHGLLSSVSNVTPVGYFFQTLWQYGHQGL